MSATVGAFLGATAASGLLLVWRSARCADLGSRVLPQVRGPFASVIAVEPSLLSVITGVATSRLMGALDALFGAHQAHARLRHAGLDWSPERFRLEQLRWAALGMSAAAAIGIAKLASGAVLAPLAWLVLVGVGGLAGACLAEQRLAQRARRRQERIARELPTVAEMLAFSVAAGLSPGLALGRVAQRSRGDLGAELRRCSQAVDAGAPMAEALRDLGPRTGVAGVGRLAETIIIALERGTPLAEVLRAQAMDARAAGHRALMESVGRREILALLPVVFLILPVVVVIAVFPGLYGLTLHVA